MISKERIESLTRLFQNHYGFVMNVAERYAPVSDLADDIVQQVYLDFIAGAVEKNWDLDRDLRPLFYQIARRKALMHWRERTRHRRLLVDEVAGSLATGLDERNKENYEMLLERTQALKGCLEKLSPQTRAIIEQHYFEGVSMKDIGESRQMKTAAIHQFFSRVRSKLRACIERILDLHQT